MARMTRREFMAVSAGSLVVTSTAELPAQPSSMPKPWYATMRRCGQINFNETDPLTMNAAAWMDYWASLKVDAVLLNGGGIVAFYPTQVPYQHRSEFLGSRDLFGEMAAAARKRKIRVVARMDCNYAYQEALDAHPEWFERNHDGSPRRKAGRVAQTAAFAVCGFCWIALPGTPEEKPQTSKSTNSALQGRNFLFPWRRFSPVPSVVK